MNILFVSSIASMVEQFNMPILDKLKDEGFNVHIVANFSKGNTNGEAYAKDFLKKLNVSNFHVLNLNIPRNPLSICALLKSSICIKNYINTKNIDILICQSPTGSFVARLANLNKIPSIYIVHGYHFYSGASFLNWLIYFPIEFLLSFLTTTAIVTNKEDFKYKKCLIGYKNYEYMPGVGVNLDVPNEYVVGRSKLRDSLGFSEADVVMLFPAEFTVRKNQSLLIRMMGFLVKNHPECKLLLFGNGPMIDDCKHLASTLGLEHSIFFMGFVNDLEKYYAAADLSLSSSLQEGLPVNLLLALKYGLPIVATSCRGNSELVLDNKNGYSLPVNVKPEKFARKIEEFLSSNHLNKYSKESLKLSLNYSIQHSISAFISIFKKTIRKI